MFIRNMKKFIFYFIVWCISLTMNAQFWRVDTIAGDELLGTKSRICYSFQDMVNGREFIIYDNSNDDFYLCIESGIFDFNGGGASGSKIVRGLVGIYDDNGKLIKKYENYCFESVGTFYNKVHSNKYSNMGGNNKKNAKNIIEHLKNGKCSVRFVLPLYQSFRFDFTVPSMNNDK